MSRLVLILALVLSLSEISRSEDVCANSCRNGATCSSGICVCPPGFTGSDCSVSSGDTAWILLCTFLVFIMTPGLAFFYGGFVSSSNSINTHMMSFVALPIIGLQWFLFGYSITFSKDAIFIYGNLWWGALYHVGGDANLDYAPTIPHLLHMLYQMMFAIITPALISGAVIGRMHFKTYVVFIILWSTIVYDITAHWVWSGSDIGTTGQKLGWLRYMGVLDFGGGIVVHLTAGTSALTAALIIGQRKKAHEALPPHNVSTVLLGAALLWFGWFGFNGGNLYMADSVAVYAAVNTQIAICGSCIVWMILERLYEGKTHASQFAIAAVVGMICSTPSSGYVEPWTEIIIGGIGGLCSFYAVRLRQRFFFDDTLDVFSAHGVGGMVGPILTGCFATKSVNPAGNNGLFYGNAQQLGVQILAVVVITALSMSVTAALLYGLKYTMGLRVSAATEERGLDSHVHGELAYLIETTDQKTGLKEVRVVPPVQVEHLVGGSLNGRIDPDGSIRNGNGSVSQHRIVGVLPSFKPLHPTLHTTGVATAVSLSGAATLEKLVTLDV
mmetsp:Transcript_27370/g.47256  ORF Transcript_27370/g.47256 Transcript_27370/m.47256 type:complete len:555 (-) Transcript_27370:538-2202(-)